VINLELANLERAKVTRGSLINKDDYFLHSLCLAAEPVFTRRPEAQKVGLNGVAEFHCGASGNPAPTIFWTKEVVILTLCCPVEAKYDPEYLQCIILPLIFT
jgi:hypothetical protein